MAADQQEEAVLQQLMKADKVHVFKIPMLKTAGGRHRAGDWNVREPLAVCQLLLEQRGDQLVLAFYRNNTIFCTATTTYDPAVGRSLSSTFVQDVADSSRYFVTKIMNEQTQQAAMIGFGFRHRAAAIDLRKALQHCEKFMRRGREASSIPNETAAKSIPPLDKDETIRVNVGGSKKATTVKKKVGGSGRKPELFKKPPPRASPKGGTKPSINATSAAEPSVSKTTDNVDYVQLNNNDGSAHDDSDVAVCADSE